MTVRELIAKLLEVDQDTEVVVDCDEVPRGQYGVIDNISASKYMTTTFIECVADGFKGSGEDE